MDVIGMTNLQEAKLAREAEICYVTIAMVTDYDCWHEEHAAVSVEQIMETFGKNVENASKLMQHVIAAIPDTRTCKCGAALRHAIITDRAAIPQSARENLGLLIGKYIGD
jgi:5'-methylthioadenosine phosphorylase